MPIRPAWRRRSTIARADTATDLVAVFPGLSPDDLPGSESWALERVQLTTHDGTHVDAPQPGHQLGRPPGGSGPGYCQIEKRHHVEELLPTGFTVSCFPVKVTGNAAGRARRRDPGRPIRSNRRARGAPRPR
jgi:hypothetical protein